MEQKLLKPRALSWKTAGAKWLRDGSSWSLPTPKNAIRVNSKQSFRQTYKIAGSLFHSRGPTRVFDFGRPNTANKYFDFYLR